jgi:hypothetical protein
MSDIKNIYFKISEGYPVENVRKRIVDAYKNYDRIRMVFDLNGIQLTGIKAMKKVKKIFEELGVEKLVETCVISHEKIKRGIVKQFLKLVKTEREVRFLPYKI